MMLPTNPEQANTADPTTAPVPHFREHWIGRITLLILHIVALIAAGSLTPAGYYFRLGEYTGNRIIFGCFILWWLLFAAKTRRGIALFCTLALGQAGFVVLVGLHWQAEDRTSKSMGEEIAAKRLEWASQLNLSRMDPLFEITSGRRNSNIEKLRELKIRARDGEAQVDIVESDVIQSRADMERRLSAVRGGGQYSQTPQGLRFNRAEDLELFNGKIDAIAAFQKQLVSFYINFIKNNFLCDEF